MPRATPKIVLIAFSNISRFSRPDEFQFPLRSTRIKLFQTISMSIDCAYRAPMRYRKIDPLVVERTIKKYAIWQTLSVVTSITLLAVLLPSHQRLQMQRRRLCKQRDNACKMLNEVQVEKKR